MPRAMTMDSRTAPAGAAAQDFVKQADGGNFDVLVLQADGPVVVEFMSYSCAHCRAVESTLQHVARQLGQGQPFFRVVVAQEADLAMRYGIEGTPTLVMFQHGAEVGRVEGPPTDAAGLLLAVTQPFAS